MAYEMRTHSDIDFEPDAEKGIEDQYKKAKQKFKDRNRQKEEIEDPGPSNYNDA